MFPQCFQHGVHFPGVFGGEVQPLRPDAQLCQVILPVQPGKLLAIEQNTAAGGAVLNDREFRAGLVHQLGAALAAGTFAGLVLEQAVLRHHQRQPAVGDDLAGNAFAHIPDLGQGHFKAETGGIEVHFPQQIHGSGIVDIQTVVTPQGKARLPHRDQQTEVAHQSFVDTQRLYFPQLGSDLGQLGIVDDPGQYRYHRQTGRQILAQHGITRQDVQRYIQCGQIGPQQGGSQLLPGGDLNGESRCAPLAGVIGRSDGFVDGGCLPTGPQSGKHVQYIPAHGVDGCGGQSQTRLHHGFHIHAAEGCAAGFLQALLDGFLGEDHSPCLFRQGAVDGAVPAFGVEDSQTAPVGQDVDDKPDVHTAVLYAFVALAHGCHPGGRLLVVFADAEHGMAGAAGVIAVGKALTVEGAGQFLHHGTGDGAFIQSLTVGAGDGGHIFGPLHPAFQFDGGNAHGFQFFQLTDQTVVLQAQGIPVLPAAVAVALAAGLGAAATVAGTAADGSGQVALTGIAHAQSTVGKHFDLNGRILADIGDLFPAQFPAQYHPGHAPGRAQPHTGQRMDGHLGRTVDRNTGGDPPAQFHNAQILDDEGIHATDCRVADQLAELNLLPVRDQSI